MREYITVKSFKGKELEANDIDYYQLLKELPIHLYIKDLNLDLIFTSEGLEKDLELTKGKVSLSEYGEKISDCKLEEIIKVDNMVLKEKKIHSCIVQVDVDGKKFVVNDTKIPLVNEYGESIGILGMTSSIKSLIERSDHYKDLALIDPLTKLWNRRYFFTTFNEILNPTNKKRDITLILFDLDNFKRLNDNYGHPVGDKVLKEVGRVLKSSFRDRDIVARLGGDEFAVLLTRLEKEKAPKIIKRLKEKIKAISISNENVEIKDIGVSIGVTHIKEDDFNYHSMYSRADKALYEAKELGKDRIIYI